MNTHKKIAIVTGASSGLGKAIAEAAARADLAVILVSRDEKRLEETLHAIQNNGGTAQMNVADVTNPARVRALVAHVVREHGRIDVLINCAGWTSPKVNIEDITDVDYARSMHTNADAIFYFMRAVVPHMKKQNEGLIINIASGAAKRGHGGLAAYSASKFAVLGLTQSVGWEVQSTGVSCIAVCPGGIDTPMRRMLFGEEDSRRQQKPEEVAAIILDVIEGKVKVPNGGDISIRQGKVTKIEDPLGA